MSDVITFLTETGSIYRITPTTAIRLRVMSDGLRRDGDELPLLARSEIRVGHPVTMVLNLRGDGIETVRRTSHVVYIKEADDVDRSQHEGDDPNR